MNTRDKVFTTITVFVGMVICKVDHIDGKLIDGVVLKIPKSEIFKKPRCFWQIKFKPIG